MYILACVNQSINQSNAVDGKIYTVQKFRVSNIYFFLLILLFSRDAFQLELNVEVKHL